MNQTITVNSANGTTAKDTSLSGAPITGRYELHPSALEVGPKGVTNFLLPCSDDDADQFCERFASRLTDALRARNIDHDRLAEALWLVLISIIFEGATLFRLTRLARLFQERDLLASWGGQASALEQIGRREKPESAILRMFLAGPSHSRVRSPWVRWLGSLARRDGYSRRPPSLLNPKRDALCIVGGAATQAVAEAEDKRLVLSRYEHWIDLDTGWRERMPQVDRREALDEVVQIAEQSFADADEIMPPQVRASFAATVEAMACVALKSLSDVESRAKSLPRTFLTGSTSQVQNRAIGRVVQKEGGSVTTFDHGVGGGWRHIPTLTTTLWDSPNRYVTYTDTHAKGIRDLIDPRYKVSDVTCVPVVSPVPLLSLRHSTSRTHRPGNQRRLRMMYVPTLYVGERYYAPGLPDDIAVVDFQARLLTYLNGQGHEVVIKPHPECGTGIRPELAVLGNATVETRLFDAVASDADLLLFDCPSSTTFRTAVCTNVPIVLIEHGRVQITEHAFSLIEQRAAVVKTRRDDQNRIDLDWTDLDHAIEEAPELRDPAFANLYFGADI